MQSARSRGPPCTWVSARSSARKLQWALAIDNAFEPIAAGLAGGNRDQRPAVDFEAAWQRCRELVILCRSNQRRTDLRAQSEQQRSSCRVPAVFDTRRRLVGEDDA